MSTVVGVLVLVGAAGLGTAMIMRVGARGENTSRALARMLHAAAGRQRTARLSSAAHARFFSFARGRALGRWFGAPVLVIETIGRRSGQVRRTPIVYARDGELFVVTPANAGSTRTPSWWLNAQDAGTATALVGGRRISVRAVEAQGTERERLWRVLLDTSPAIRHYQDFTTRHFPIVVLDPTPLTDTSAAADALERTVQ